MTKKGEDVYVRDPDAGPRWFGPQEFRGTIDGKFLAKNNLSGNYQVWDEMKPVEKKEDLKPKEGEMVIIKDEDMTDWAIEPEELRGVVDGKFVTLDAHGTHSIWDMAKLPLKVEEELKEYWLLFIPKSLTIKCYRSAVYATKRQNEVGGQIMHVREAAQEEEQ